MDKFQNICLRGTKMFVKKPRWVIRVYEIKYRHEYNLVSRYRNDFSIQSSWQLLIKTEHHVLNSYLELFPECKTQRCEHRGKEITQMTKIEVKELPRYQT